MANLARLCNVRCLIAGCWKAFSRLLLHDNRIFVAILTSIGIWQYSPRCLHTITAQHLSTCQVNFSESLMFTHVTDFALRLSLLWLSQRPAEPPLTVELSLLVRPQSATTCQKQSILSSVRPSVTLVYCDRTMQDTAEF